MKSKLKPMYLSINTEHIDSIGSPSMAAQPSWSLLPRQAYPNKGWTHHKFLVCLTWPQKRQGGWIVIEGHCFNRELLEDWGTQLGSPPPGDLSQQRFDAATKLFCLQNLMLYNLSLIQSISFLPVPLSATLQVNATLKSVQTQESNTVGFVQGKTLSSVMNMEM